MPACDGPRPHESLLVWCPCGADSWLQTTTQHTHTRTHRRKSQTAAPDPPHSPNLCKNLFFFSFILLLHFVFSNVRSRHHVHRIVSSPDVSTTSSPPVLFKLLCSLLSHRCLTRERVVRVSACACARGNDTVSTSGKLSDAPDLLGSAPDVKH